MCHTPLWNTHLKLGMEAFIPFHLEIVPTADTKGTSPEVESDLGGNQHISKVQDREQNFHTNHIKNGGSSLPPVCVCHGG